MSESPNSGARAWLAPMSIFVVALAVRLAYLHSVATAPFFDNLVTNAARYDEWARLILEGHAPRPPFEQAAGYAYFIALIYRLSGAALSNVYVTQALLDAAAAALLVPLGTRLFDRPSGVIAALLAALYGPLILSCGELVPATLPVFLVIAALAGLAAEQWIIAGVIWGLAVAVRSELLVGLPFLLLAAAARRHLGAATRVGFGMAIGLVFVLTLNTGSGTSSAWLPQSGGLNLWLGNNPNADGVSPFITPELEPTADAIRTTAGGDARLADRLFRNQAEQFIGDNPWAAVALGFKKLVWTFTNRELPNTSDPDWQSSYSWLFRLPALPLSFGMVLPFALAGLPSLRRKSVPVLMAPVSIALMTCVVFFTNGRFRLIMLPSLLLLAGLTVRSVRTTWRDRRTIVLSAALAGLGIVLAWSDAWGVHSYRIPEIDINTGAMEREAGHIDAAIDYLRRGLSERSGDAIGTVHLALAYEQANLLPEALNTYIGGLLANPHDATLNERSAGFFKRHHLDAALLARFLGSADENERETILNQLVDSFG